MPLSGWAEEDNQANSEEENEKLISKEPEENANQAEIDRLEYILQNFEDVNYDDFKDLDLMKIQSVVDLKDDIYPTPELKSIISNRLISLTKKSENDSLSNFKLPTVPLFKKNSSHNEHIKKRDMKELQKIEENISTAESNKSEPHLNKSNSNSQVSSFKKKKKKKNKNKINNDFRNLANSLK